VAKATKAPKEKGGGLPIIPILLVTLLGAGAGGLFGMQVPGLLAPKAGEEQKPEPKANASGVKFNIRDLAPITTNLASPANTWIRLETAALIKEDLGENGSVLMAQLAEDVVAYLRTVPLDQIEGPSGFQNLREDLNDRVRIRSEGKVTELIIQALVVE
jgi:flagellar protein FliL